ncbi:MAG: hypothetical protein RQ735_00815 [Flavobacteriaceae bacterium]|nr:hypothetical protein [Flavobacteriaceae bacterium]
MLRFYTLLCGLLILGTYPLIGQTKFEKESRAKESEVPDAAKAFVSSLTEIKNLKWYKEISTSGQSIEAKFKKNKAKYSVEFDTLGNLEDVEKTVDWETLTRMQQEKIIRGLDAVFSKFSIQKVQLQYKGSLEDLANLIQTDQRSLKIELAFELIVKGTKEEKRQYEILFLESGHMHSINEIIFKSADHLVF